MKSILSFLLLTIFAVPALANVTYAYSCRSSQNLDLNGPVTINFKIQITPSGEFKYVGDIENPFNVTPKKSQMAELNENGSIRQDKEKVTFFGDGDGFVFVYLVLYKNTSYTAGFARVQDGGGGMGNYYSTVSCQVKKLF